MKISLKTTRKKRDTEFEKYLQKIEDPEYRGQDVSWHLPDNATPVEKVKYALCEKILNHQQSNDLSDEEIADKVKITVGEARDILYCHIDYFTLENLINYANRLFAPSQIKIVIELEKKHKTTYARAI